MEAERVFSSVGNVVTKLRSRLYDGTVNALVFRKTLLFVPTMSVCMYVL